MKKAILIYFFLLILITFSFSQKEEMRGVWVATVKNIDYPSSKTLTTQEQKQEFINMIDKFEEIGINAVFFQVRPAADAFYNSPYEPWSEWLTGKQGKAPSPFYDPMEFMITECHNRNIEFHAWINPFRAVATIEFADITKNHISNKKPEWLFTYDVNKYFNPGLPEVRNYVKKVVLDIVKRYNIDGIHFDDYFYPYPIKDKNKNILPINDKEAYAKYGKDFSNIGDWRRNNMNLFIEEISTSIKKIKPQISFGIAPSGVWRNKSKDPEGSNTRGLAHYDYLYSDVLLWLKNDWIDYVAPQLYWVIGNKYADYKTLVRWWSNHSYGKHLYIGHALYQAKKDALSSSWRNPNEIPNQLKIARANPNVYGSIFYKAKDLLANKLNITNNIKYNFYSTKVSTPKMPWLVNIDTTIIADDIIKENTNIPFDFTYVKLGNKIVISWKYNKQTSSDDIKFKVYKFQNYDFKDTDAINVLEITNKDFIIIKRKRFSLFRKEYKFAVTSVNENNIESKESNLLLIKL